MFNVYRETPLCMKRASNLILYDAMTCNPIRTKVCLYSTDKPSSKNTSSDFDSIATVSIFGCNTILIKIFHGSPQSLSADA
jgi:hypothetical protein